MLVGAGDLLQAGLHSPDFAGVLGDRTVAGELATAGDVVNHHLGPLLGVLFEINETRRGLDSTIGSIVNNIQNA